jgi:outer membrane immunogenic protein
MKNLGLTALFLSGGLALLSTASRAADPIDPVFDWSGPYIGGTFGYVFGEDRNRDSNVVSTTVDHRTKFDVDGFGLGLKAGYDHQMGNLILGIIADAEISDVNGKTDDWAFGDTIKSTIDGEATLRARFGFAADTTMFYLTGGLALGFIDAKYTEGAAIDKRDGVELGYTVGAGIEHAFNEQWSMLAEYRYTDFEPLKGENVNTDPGWNYLDNMNVHAIRIGLNYHF